MSRKLVRVDIPSDPSEAIVLLGKVEAKHKSLGDASPLKGMEWVDNISPALARAAEHDALADQFRSDAERETGTRNKEMPAVKEALRGARDVLLGLYRSNPKMLVDFGYDVSDSPTGGDTPTPASDVKK